jgi:hypothetical protein
MTAAGIAAALGAAHRLGVWWRCRCLVHKNPSVLLPNGDGGLTLRAAGPRAAITAG